MAGFKTIENRQ